MDALVDVDWLAEPLGDATGERLVDALADWDPLAEPLAEATGDVLVEVLAEALSEASGDVLWEKLPEARGEKLAPPGVVERADVPTRPGPGGVPDHDPAGRGAGC